MMLFLIYIVSVIICLIGARTAKWDPFAAAMFIPVLNTMFAAVGLATLFVLLVFGPLLYLGDKLGGIK